MRSLTTSVLIASLVGGCASGPNSDPRDPIEPLNRAVYSFNNDLLDQVLLKPLAEVYNHVVPDPVSERVSCFFSNLGDVVVTGNDLLQLKFSQGLQDGIRFVYNTTFGLGGLFDVATVWGLPKHNADFGQTLGYWGVGPGPYLVLPLVGPRTARDAVGLVTDSSLNLLYQIDPVATRNKVVALSIVDTRSNLLGAGNVLQEAALDPYLFVRDAYLQRRENLVRDAQQPADDAVDGATSEKVTK